MMCAAQAGPARPPRAADRALSRARREDPHLRRRPLQLHQRPRVGPRNYLSQQSATSAAPRSRATPPRDFVRWSSATAFAYHEKKLGQLFCDRAADGLIDMLKAECERGRVTWRMPCAVERRGARRRPLRRRDVAGPMRAARRSSSRPAGSPSPRSARRRSHTASPSSSDSPSLRRGRRWCRSPLRPTSSRATATSRGIGRRRGHVRRRALSREPAVHASRPVRPAILQISSYWDGRTPIVDRSAARHRRGSVACVASAAARRASPTCWPSSCRGASRSSGARRTISRGRCARSTPQRSGAAR